MFPPDYKAHIHRIIDSKDFGRSKAYARLLEYIVERSVSGDIPKEATIAMEVFGKGPEYNSSGDTLVRVYMHNLRKKLDRYYTAAGSEELERLVILKGKYQAIFYSKSEWDLDEVSVSAPPTTGRRQYLMAIGLLFLISCASIGMNIWLVGKSKSLTTTEQILQESAIWNSFLRQGEPVDIVLGDIFVYEEYDSLLGRSRTVRDAAINSLDELESWQQEILSTTQRETASSPNPLLMKAQATVLTELIPFLHASGQESSLRLISRMVPENLQEGPFVYVGMYKSMGILSYVLASSHFKVLEGYDGLLHLPDSSLLTGSGEHTAHHTDIAYFSQRKGPKGNLFWVIAALTDTGLLQIAQILSEKEELAAFEEQLMEYLQGIPNEWEAVCKVKGFDRTQLEMEIAYVYSLP